MNYMDTWSFYKSVASQQTARLQSGRVECLLCFACSSEAVLLSALQMLSHLATSLGYLTCSQQLYLLNFRLFKCQKSRVQTYVQSPLGVCGCFLNYYDTVWHPQSRGVAASLNTGKYITIMLSISMCWRHSKCVCISKPNGKVIINGSKFLKVSKGFPH